MWFTIFVELCTLFQKLVQSVSCLKKNLEFESILHNSTELSVDWTFREFQNQTILFLEKIKFSI